MNILLYMSPQALAFNASKVKDGEISDPDLVSRLLADPISGQPIIYCLLVANRGAKVAETADGGCVLSYYDANGVDSVEQMEAFFTATYPEAPISVLGYWDDDGSLVEMRDSTRFNEIKDVPEVVYIGLRKLRAGCDPIPYVQHEHVKE